ncbi:hypothetical protein DRH29_00405 [candidate division Kazan bacterium]|uniref:Thioredoxin domain-containing protein n=1 Tax=candidate division Kazan bacterium TaxID=2202143 RepID=A0A420ZE13_UNCK3|nr:MAG: hypothetical protein DRH29_00405 [candidate division Kazan bacterium]
MNNKILAVGFLMITIFLLSAASCSKPAGFDTEQKVALAKHLTDSGIKLYGAFWCGHCGDQKNLFGEEAFQYIDYTECSTPDGTAQTEVCIEEGITSYPTWEFANGERIFGVYPLKELAEKSGFNTDK